MAHHWNVRFIVIDDKRATPLVGDDDVIGSSARVTDSCRRCVDDTSDRL